MVEKRKRAQDHQYEDEETEHPSNYDLKPPQVAGAHLYTNKNELPWDNQPYAHLSECLTNSMFRRTNVLPQILEAALQHVFPLRSRNMDYR